MWDNSSNSRLVEVTMRTRNRGRTQKTGKGGARCGGESGSGKSKGISVRKETLMPIAKRGASWRSHVMEGGTNSFGRGKYAQEC